MKDLKIFKKTKKHENHAIWRVLLMSIVLFLLAAWIFLWQRELHFCNKNYVADNVLLGTFGDFISGIFAFISCLLLVKTLWLQQNDSSENYHSLELQRFNSIFFELLHLYQSEVAELSSTMYEIDKNEAQEVHATNKDFFYLEKIKIQNNFIPQDNFNADRRLANLKYQKFYSKHGPIAYCFRTLYRIYDLIDSSTVLSYKEKSDYIKIVRAQLSEDELFFLRYNSFSYYGYNFRVYLHKYHVLKHLQLFDLLEFKKYWKNWNTEDRVALNSAFCKLTDVIKEIISPPC